MLQLLRVVAVIPIVIVARIRRHERRLVDWFRARGALDADRAVTVSSDGRVATWVQQRLIRAGVIRPAGERYYLDEGTYQVFLWRRRKRGLIVLALLLIALMIAFYSTGDPSL